MKRFLSIFTISTLLFLTACSGNKSEAEHSHGEDGDHIHEQPAQLPSYDAPVRIGGSAADSTHGHDDDSDHVHGEDTDHSHDSDSTNAKDEDTHSHGDEDHSHN